MMELFVTIVNFRTLLIIVTKGFALPQAVASCKSIFFVLGNYLYKVIAKRKLKIKFIKDSFYFFNFLPYCFIFLSSCNEIIAENNKKNPTKAGLFLGDLTSSISLL